MKSVALSSGYATVTTPSTFRITKSRARILRQRTAQASASSFQSVKQSGASENALTLRPAAVYKGVRMNALIVAGAVVVTMLGGRVATAQPSDPARPASLEQQLAIYKHLLGDWAGLSRYGSDDAELPPPAPGEARVVFIGAQIVESWRADGRAFFPGRPYINRGITGQTTGQMLVRFRQDVIALKPKVVVIAGGTNDLTGVLGPGTEGTIADNIMSMTELARANGIR